MTKEEIQEFKKENCNKCTKNIDCKITRNVEGKLVCVEDQLMKDKINYANCMKRKCEQCKYYYYCFRYRKEGGNKNVSKSDRQIQKIKFKR